MRALRESMALPCSAPPEGYAGLVAPAPTSGPTRPTPGVPFVSRRKEPKACQGRCPWTPLGGYYHPPSGGKRRSPPERGASSDGTQAINRLPRHGLTAESVPPVQLGEKIRPICPPTQSGKSVFFCGTNPIEGVAGTAGGAGAKSVSLFTRSPSRGPGAAALGAPLVTFSSGRKSPGVEGRSALLSGAVGAKGPHLGSAEGRSPA